MNDSDFLWRMYKYKEKEWLKEAERIRLHRRGRPNPEGISRVLGQFLDNAGKRMVFWELSLKRRYGIAVK